MFRRSAYNIRNVYIYISFPIRKSSSNLHLSAMNNAICLCEWKNRSTVLKAILHVYDYSHPSHELPRMCEVWVAEWSHTSNLLSIWLRFIIILSAVEEGRFHCNQFSAIQMQSTQSVQRMNWEFDIQLLTELRQLGNEEYTIWLSFDAEAHPFEEATKCTKSY